MAIAEHRFGAISAAEKATPKAAEGARISPLFRSVWRSLLAGGFAKARWRIETFFAMSAERLSRFRHFPIVARSTPGRSAFYGTCLARIA
jgi:hypothetical protein